jgi:hypothetical protein
MKTRLGKRDSRNAIQETRFKNRDYDILHIQKGLKSLNGVLSLSIIPQRVTLKISTAEQSPLRVILDGYLCEKCRIG